MMFDILVNNRGRDKVLVKKDSANSFISRESSVIHSVHKNENTQR
jgi:hypothetical protein